MLVRQRTAISCVIGVRSRQVWFPLVCSSITSLQLLKEGWSGQCALPCTAFPPISIHLLRSNRLRLIFPTLPLRTSPNYTLDQNSFRGIVKRQKVAKNCVSILIPPAPCYLDRSSVQLHAKGQKWANSKSLFDLGKSLEAKWSHTRRWVCLLSTCQQSLTFKQKFLNKSHEM